MYKRILLKLSGEALKADAKDSIYSEEGFLPIVNTIIELHKRGTQIGIVIGGGNIWRGKLAEQLSLEREPADYMGMCATVINCLAMASALNNRGVKATVFNALGAFPEAVCKDYNEEDANKALENGEIVFFAGGCGKPYFTTDTASAKRAIETKCDAILMAKNGVEGVYDKDPRFHDDAKFIKNITYQKVLDLKLGVMDLTAIELLMNTELQIRVFAMSNPENIIRVVDGEDIGTTVRR